MKRTRLISLVLAIIFLLSAFILPVQAAAAEGTGSITVITKSKSGDKVVPGVSLAVYKVADFDVRLNKMTVVEEFADSGVTQHDMLYDTEASIAKLEAVIEKNGVEPVAEGVSDSNCVAKFTGLEDGVYLVRQTSDKDITGKLTVTIIPFLISIPYADEDGHMTDYDPVCYPKIDVEEEPEPPEYITLRVKKVWNDSNDRAELRPSFVDVQLWGNGVVRDTARLTAENYWTHLWTGLNKAYEWEIREVNVPEGYTSEIEWTDANTVTITNTYEPEITTIKVIKVWNDNDDSAHARPEYVEAALYGDGVLVDTVRLSEANGWSYTWTDLLKDVKWEVREPELPERYTSQVTWIDDNTVAIVNTYEPEETTVVIVNKVWADENNWANVRPDYIDVELYGDGELVGTARLNAENNWTYIWTDLSKDVKWEVKEPAVPEGYTSQVTWTDETTVSIVNTYVPKTIAIVVNKVWEDKDDSAQARPDYIDVELYGDGKLVGTARLTAENNWTYTWVDLSQDVKWEVKEPSVPEGYTSKVTWANGTTVTVTNTYKEVEPPPSPKPPTPFTGDTSHFIMWFAMSLASLAILIALVVVIVVRTRKKSEK